MTDKKSGSSLFLWDGERTEGIERQRIKVTVADSFSDLDLVVEVFELVGVIRDIGYAFGIVLFNNLLCEVLARCAFSLFCHFVHSFFLSFIVAHFFPIAKSVLVIFLTYTLYFTSSSRVVILKYSGFYSVIVLSHSLKYIFIWLHKCNQ